MHPTAPNPAPTPPPPPPPNLSNHPSQQPSQNHGAWHAHTPAPPQAHEGLAAQRRDVFWQNVVREVLMTLAVAAGSSGRLSPTPTGAATSPAPTDDLFDGRMGIITTLGQRIPIADIYPVFACSINTSRHQRDLSADVQCTVFRILTPGGESFTLPISQIVAVHSLSPELIAQLEAAGETTEIDEDGRTQSRPFGFGAYTSLARQAEEMARDPDAPDSGGIDTDTQTDPDES